MDEADMQDTQAELTVVKPNLTLVKNDAPRRARVLHIDEREDVVARLAEALEHAKAGRLRGIALAGEFTGDDGNSGMMTVFQMTHRGNIATLLGVIEIVKHRILTGGG